MKKKERMNPLATLVALAMGAVCVVPFAYILLRAGVGEDGSATGLNYYNVFLAEPYYLLRFFRSLALAAVVAVGNLVVSTLAGFGFAKFRFPGKNGMFFFLMVLMILPLQVTLVPNYQVLSAMGLLNTYAALALPAIFTPLSTFILTQTFRAVPGELLDAARLDGCSIWGLLLRVAVPMNKGGMACALLLSFLDGWNMVEQPIVYLDDFADYPIAVALSTVRTGSVGIQLAACALVMIPPVLLFAVYHRELTEGISLGRDK